MKSFLMKLPIHARTIAISIVLVVSGVLTYVMLNLGIWFMESNQRIYDLVPRISRLYGYALNEDKLRESAESVQIQLSEVAYPAGEDSSTIGVAVQQQLRRYMENSGLSVSSSQLLASRPHEGFEELRVELTASGSMDALDLALLNLRQARPVLLIESLELSPRSNRRRGDDDQVVIASFNVSAVKLL